MTTPSREHEQPRERVLDRADADEAVESSPATRCPVARSRPFMWEGSWSTTITEIAIVISA